MATIVSRKINEAYGEGNVFAMSYNQDMARNYHLATRENAQPINEDGRLIWLTQQ